MMGAFLGAVPNLLEVAGPTPGRISDIVSASSRAALHPEWLLLSFCCSDTGAHARNFTSRTSIVRKSDAAFGKVLEENCVAQFHEQLACC
jgi:hypothetical protein